MDEETDEMSRAEEIFCGLCMLVVGSSYAIFPFVTKSAAWAVIFAPGVPLGLLLIVAGARLVLGR